MVQIMNNDINVIHSVYNIMVRLYLRAKRNLIKVNLKVRIIPIKQRIFLGLLVISILPILIVGFYSNFNYEKSITSKLSSYSGQLIKEITRNVKNETNQYEKLSERIITNDDVQAGITQFDRISDFQKNELYKKLTDNFSAELFKYNNLKNISIRFLDGKIFYDFGYEIFNENKISEIIKNVNSAPGNIYWAYLRSNQGNNCIVLCRAIYSTGNYLQRKGYLLIVIDEKIFAGNTYKNLDLGDGSQLFIMKDNGVIISSASSNLQVGSVYEDMNLKNKIFLNYKKNIDAFKYNCSGGEFIIAGSYIPAQNWYIVGCIPYSFIGSQSSEVKTTVIYTCIVVILLSIFLSLFIYISFSVPMNLLLNYVESIKSGNLEVTIEDKYDDEISELSFNIRIMVERLKSLIHEVENQQTKKREAELKMLQAQINPHFLFNTLNSLKWSAMLSGNKTLEDGIGALSGLLKDTILNKDELVLLENEIENLNNYATIQCIRYGNSFNISYDINNSLKKSRVLKFILQPIVENSIIHGIDENENPINIKISAENVENAIHIRISDDGKGFDLECFSSNSNDNKLSGIGIHNVNERIKINFGENYGLVTNSKLGIGTITDIILPLILRKEDNKNV